MTAIEQRIANALLKCRFLPGSFDKKFVRQLPNWADRSMTRSGRDMLVVLLKKYRKQIPEYDELLLAVEPDTFSIKFDMFGDATIRRLST